jgi:hypothetical protein
MDPAPMNPSRTSPLPSTASPPLDAAAAEWM